MKRLRITGLCLAVSLSVAASFAVSSCRGKSTFKPSSSSDPTAALEKAALELCRYIPDHGMAKGAERHMTKDFYEAVAQAFDAPEGVYGEIGEGEWLLYLVSGNGDSEPRFEVISAEMSSPKTATATIGVTDSFDPDGEVGIHEMILALEDGKWKIDDFDSIKQRCRWYVARLRERYSSGEILRSLQSSEYTRDYVEEFTRELEEFYRKWGK
ncbi:MAG: hypothetical protein IJV54_02635 [Bacteroidales bacterium]|nr:hypothetical protein [Bacteroidales bacterium]